MTIRITVSGQEIYVGEDGIIEVDTDYQGEVPDVPDEPPEPVAVQFQAEYGVAFGTPTSSGGLRKNTHELFGPGYEDVTQGMTMEFRSEADGVLLNCSASEAGGGVLFQSIAHLRKQWPAPEYQNIVNKLNATGLPDTAWIPTPKDGYGQSGFAFCNKALVAGRRYDLDIYSSNPAWGPGTLWFTWVQPTNPDAIASFTRVQGGSVADIKYVYPGDGA